MTSTPFGAREFRKATRSEPNQACVEVARRDGVVEVRDTKTTFGAADDARITVTDIEFDAFQAAIRGGSAVTESLSVVEDHDGLVMTAAGQQAQLRFTEAEIVAFYDGVHNQEFDRVAFAV